MRRKRRSVETIAEPTLDDREELVGLMRNVVAHTETSPRLTGGCLCGALRYEARGEPLNAGYCCCADCRKASGSGFIPFMGFAAEAGTFSGPARQFRSPSLRGEAVRNSCPT